MREDRGMGEELRRIKSKEKMPIIAIMNEMRLILLDYIWKRL